MISLTPDGLSRKAYLDSKGVSVTRPDAVRELDSGKPLLPVCLVTYPMYSGAFLCFNINDVQSLEVGPAIKWEWYLLDVDEVIEDFPEYSRTIRLARGMK